MKNSTWLELVPSVHHGQSENFFRKITFFRLFHPLQFVLMLFWVCAWRKSRYKRVFRKVNDLHWLSYVYYGEIMGPHHFEVNHLPPHTEKNWCQKVAINSWHASKGQKLVKKSIFAWNQYSKLSIPLFINQFFL